MRPGLSALAVDLPERVITNDWWRERSPEQVARAEAHALARLWGRDGEPVDAATALFDDAMAPYLADPFRGTVERRWLDERETSLDREVMVARDALAAAGRTVADIDLLLCVSFVPDQWMVGNAAYLGRALGARCPAINLESACAGSLAALRTAAALVQAGEAHRVLIVVSCHYSRALDPDDSLSWFLGDGAAALIVEPVGPAGRGGAELCGFHTVHTQQSCGTLYAEPFTDARGTRLAVRNTPDASRALRTTAVPTLLTCVSGALERARERPEDVACYALNTPVAWSAAFSARALEVPLARIPSTWSRTANAGPALMPLNLHHAATTGGVRADDLVLAYAIGSVSTAGAAVLRWGEVALGPALR